MDIQELHALFLECRSISTDTRKITKDDLFFALKGDTFNGNEFAQQALDSGAKYAVIDEKKYATSQRFILVDDALSTLQELASFHRNHLNIPIIALTGSNGKTTTKELIHSVLSKKYTTVATKGNLNNHIGVPLTLLSMDSSTELGIVEMGANHLKEIEFLTSITKPDYGYITNFGKAHLEGFGSIEGIIQGKSELYDFLDDHQKLIFVNGQDATQMLRTQNSKRYVFGNEESNPDVVISLKECNPNVSVLYNGLEIESQLIGSYNFGNISAAIAIGHYFKVNGIDIKDAIENYVPRNNRSQILELGTNKIILDAYNANPTSMEAAIRNIHGLSAKRKVLILGDMFELGSSAKTEHQAIVNLLMDLGFDEIVLVGKNFFDTNGSKGIKRHENFESLKLALDKTSFQNATLLIKGSRGMALERVLDLLKIKNPKT